MYNTIYCYIVMYDCYNIFLTQDISKMLYKPQQQNIILVINKIHITTKVETNHCYVGVN